MILKKYRCVFSSGKRRISLLILLLMAFSIVGILMVGMRASAADSAFPTVEDDFCVSNQIYLPVAQQLYFGSVIEAEDNDDSLTANGPLRKNDTNGWAEIDGWIDDRKDYFSFFVSGNGRITIRLKHSGGGDKLYAAGVQMVLYHAGLERKLVTVDDRVGHAPGPNYTIELPEEDVKTGWYYIQIFVPNDHPARKDYSLEIEYPTDEYNGPTLTPAPTCAPYDEPACPLDGYTDSDSYVVFNPAHKIYSDREEAEAASGPELLTQPIEAGTYKVFLSSHDNHFSQSYPTPQVREQWFLKLYNQQGVLIGTSEPTDDLSESDECAIFAIEIPVAISGRAVSAVAFHAAYPDESSPNSVVPAWAALELVQTSGANLQATPSRVPATATPTATLTATPTRTRFPTLTPDPSVPTLTPPLP